MKNQITLLFFVCLFCILSKTQASTKFNDRTKYSSVKIESLKEKLKPIAIGTSELSFSTSAFTENKGQLFGYDGRPHSEVKFYFQNGGTQLFLLEKGIAYQFTKIHYPETYIELMADKRSKKDKKKLKDLQKQFHTETFRMDMTLVGANKNPEITAEGKSADYTNFYNHNLFDVHSYSKIIYHEIYPGIDWVIYTKDTESDSYRIKYDFVVKPGADPSMIKMEFNHQEDISLNNDGSFTLKNSMGSVTEKSPVSFQGEKKIATHFILENKVISFLLSNYSPSQTLIIDPVLLWATYYGGYDADFGYACATDISGNVYLSGTTASSISIASGGHQNTFGGAFVEGDAFLVKFNSAGIRQWATYYGGEDDDDGYFCSTDASGNIYLAGSTASTLNIASAGHQNTYAGGINSGDAFLVKFNNAGIRQWCTYYGGDSDEEGFSCATDAFGNVYLAGTTGSTVNVASGGHQNTFGGASAFNFFDGDAFLVKFSGAGIRQWGTYFGGNDDDDAYSCASDASGNVYLAGTTSSSTGIATGGHQNSFGGGSSDAYLAKFNGAGIRQWGTYYGGTGYEYGNSCASDASGNVYLAGLTTTTINIASGVHQNTFGGTEDAFIVKFNGSGARQWGTYYGGTSGETANSCAIDIAGNVYLSGFTNSTASIASGGSQNTHGGGTWDAFFAKFSSNGVRQWGSYFGGIGEERGGYCATDASSNIYLAGHTDLFSNIPPGGHQYTYGGGTFDGFLVKFDNSPAQTNIEENIEGNNRPCMVYPNPSKGEFVIEISQELNISVCNSFGQIIMKQHLMEGKNKIDFSKQEKGIYFIQINRAGTIGILKIIKE